MHRRYLHLPHKFLPMAQKKRNAKGSVALESIKGRLRLRLPRQAFNGKQKYLYVGFADTPESRKMATAIAKQIESDLIWRKFDPTLNKYKSNGTAKKKREKIIEKHYADILKMAAIKPID